MAESLEFRYIECSADRQWSYSTSIILLLWLLYTRGKQGLHVGLVQHKLHFTFSRI